MTCDQTERIVIVEFGLSPDHLIHFISLSFIRHRKIFAQTKLFVGSLYGFLSGMSAIYVEVWTALSYLKSIIFSGRRV